MNDLIIQLPILAKIIPYILVINILLSAVSQGLDVLGKKIPLLEKASVLLKKLVDLISANPKH